MWVSIFVGLCNVGIMLHAFGFRRKQINNSRIGEYFEISNICWFSTFFRRLSYCYYFGVSYYHVPGTLCRPIKLRRSFALNHVCNIHASDNARGRISTCVTSLQSISHRGKRVETPRSTERTERYIAQNTGSDYAIKNYSQKFMFTLSILIWIIILLRAPFTISTWVYYV